MILWNCQWSLIRLVPGLHETQNVWGFLKKFSNFQSILKENYENFGLNNSKDIYRIGSRFEEECIEK